LIQQMEEAEGLVFRKKELIFRKGRK